MIKILAVLIFISSNIFAITLEEMNQYIKDALHPTNKQLLICEREAEYIKKNPQECLKTAEMLLADKKKCYR